jgi:hypothetical protein
MWILHEQTAQLLKNLRKYHSVVRKSLYSISMLYQEDIFNEFLEIIDPRIAWNILKDCFEKNLTMPQNLCCLTN